MSDEKSIRERVRAIVCEQLNILEEKLTNGAHFVKDFSADSLDTVELVMEYEDEFDIDIPDDDGQKMLTVNDVVAYIEWVKEGKKGRSPLDGK